MSFGRLKDSFYWLILGLTSIPRTVFCFIFGRFLQVNDAEELIPPVSDDDESLIEDKDVNEASNSPTSIQHAQTKYLENPQQTNLPDADVSVDVSTMMKSNENALNAKPIDNEDSTEETTIPVEGNQGGSCLKTADLTPQTNESVIIEEMNDQPHEIVEAEAIQDEKDEHSGDARHSNSTSSDNHSQKAKNSGGSIHKTFPATTSLRDETKPNKRRREDETTNPKKNIRKQKRAPAIPSHGAGIENDSNSCYLDSTLFSFFYKEVIFDGRLLYGDEAKDTRNETSEEVTHHLSEIAQRLRENNYCPSSYVTELRKSMRHVNERIMSAMMDVDELLSNLLGKALHLNPFIMYCTKQGITTGNFYHQILINPNLKRERFGTVQDLLEESMKMQHLTFNEPPTPALIIKMPRSNGQLVGHQRIIPNLELDISKQLKDSSDKTIHLYELSSVITLNTLHYTAYVRRNTDAVGESIACWEYFNDLSPTIRKVTSLDSLLTNISNNDTNPDFERITRDIHVCIYNPIENTR